MAPVISRAPETFRKLAALDFGTLDPMLFRDALDLARTAAQRVCIFAIYRTELQIDAWRKQRPDSDGERVLACIHAVVELMRRLADLLEAHEDYSMFDALVRLQRCQPTNPNFERTLKNNAENWYCRSFIYELFRMCYIPEHEAVEEAVSGIVRAGDRSFGPQPQSLRDRQAEIRARYREIPLKDIAPDHEAAKKALPATLTALAEIAEKLIGMLEKLPG